MNNKFDELHVLREDVVILRANIDKLIDENTRLKVELAKRLVKVDELKEQLADLKAEYYYQSSIESEV